MLIDLEIESCLIGVMEKVRVERVDDRDADAMPRDKAWNDWLYVISLQVIRGLVDRVINVSQFRSSSPLTA